MADIRYFYGLGKRKTARAKVRVYVTGTGKITINGKDISEYITVAEFRRVVVSPLDLVNLSKKVDVSILTSGGGIRGQSDAMKHGISRALIEFDPNLRPTLKKEGFLTRDSRKKERKKPGLLGARRAPQFSKR